MDAGTQLAAAESADGKGAALRQLEAAALAAVRAVSSEPEAAPVWLSALEALTAAGAPPHGLLDQLAAACLGQRKGHVRVSLLQGALADSNV